MRFKLLTGGVAGCLLAVVGSAQAGTTLDFAGYADNVTPGEQAVEVSPSANPLQDPIYVPIATTALGYNGNSGDLLSDLEEDPFAYLDENDAGLGVCQAVSGRDCTPGSDDNLQEGEVLGLSWTQDLFINSISFNGEDHPNGDSDDFDGSETFALSYDSGENWMDYPLIHSDSGAFNAGGILVSAGNSILFAFGGTDSPNGPGEQYYVSALDVSPVPVPAAVWLMGSALVLLVGVGRRGRRRGAGAQAVTA